MLNFVICDDNRNFSKMMKTEIENFMMNYDQKYKIFHFEGYDESFEDFVKKEIGFKIYFLDIKTKCKSGLDAARIIREKYDDWVSIIVVVTSHEEYRYEALGNRLYFKELYNMEKSLYNVYGYILFSIYGKKSFKETIKDHPSKIKVFILYLPVKIISIIRK